MEYIEIPHLKHNVSRIGLGTWAIGGWMWGGAEEKESIATICHALDLGLNLIDTAPVYGFGIAEEVIGKALKSYGQRDRIILATKVGLSWKDRKIYRDARKEIIIKELEDSLKRLGSDYIDLYQLHWPDPLVPISETAEALKKLLDQGKIRAIGVSNFSTHQMEEFQKYAPLHSLQSPFNLFERKIEHEELAYCIQSGIATLGYGSLCRGLLSGSMDQNHHFEGDDLRKIDPKFQLPRFASYLKATHKLKEWAKNKYDKPLLALAIRWALDMGISVALWGARHPDQLNTLDSIWGWELTENDFIEIDEILQETIPSPIGPEFMNPPSSDKVLK
ncbi:MAG: aldo/keto reductase [Simkaniaceae bacterium]|nr:aldo/keto reductase [Simkaniaceae bacterium]